MNARIVVTVTAKVYLGSDVDLTGAEPCSPNRFPECTQQMMLTEVCERRTEYGVEASIAELGNRCSRSVGDACRDAVAKHFKS